MKITIVGSGNVGTSCANILSQKNLARQIILIDINNKISKGKSLDLAQMNVVIGSHTKIIGCSDYKLSKNSDIIVISCGIPRKPGMDRDDLLKINVKIIRESVRKSIFYSPNAILIIVSNPLDVLSYESYITSKIHSSRIIGMAGILDIARYYFFLSKKINISPSNIQSIILGTHGETMLPLYRYTTISGIPIKKFISEEENNLIIQKTIKGGEEIVNYLNTSAYFAPGASIVSLIESIIYNSKKIFSCSTLLKGEYGINDIFIGAPVIIGKNGVEKVIELSLNKHERNFLKRSENNIRQMLDKL